MERSSRRQRNCTSRRNRSVYGQSRAGRHGVRFAVDHVHPGQRGLCRVHRIGPAGPEPANRSAALHPASPLEAGVYPGGGGPVSPRVEGGEAEAADHLGRDPKPGAGRGEALEVYWVPLSVWKITPATSPPRVATAMLTAASASSAVGWQSDRAKPSSFRENRSSTAPKNTGPSPVGICLKFPAHFWSTRAALKIAAQQVRSGSGAAVGAGEAPVGGCCWVQRGGRGNTPRLRSPTRWGWRGALSPSGASTGLSTASPDWQTAARGRGGRPRTNPKPHHLMGHCPSVR